jgi:hypothetical protein
VLKETLVALIDLVSLFLQREKLYMLISSCSADKQPTDAQQPTDVQELKPLF